MVRILLLDDEQIIVKMVQRRLEGAGYEVWVALNGAQALEMIEIARPDLIILDLMMPKMNGYEVCEKLKQSPRDSGIPILLFTALTQERDLQRALMAGADDYITKPFKAELLIEKIEELLKRQKT